MKNLRFKKGAVVKIYAIGSPDPVWGKVVKISSKKIVICTGEDEGGGSCSSETSKVDGAFAGEFKGSFFD